MVRPVIVFLFILAFAQSAVAVEESTSDPDYSAMTGYGETQYRDADLHFDTENESTIDPEKVFATDYRRARMAFLFGEYETAFKIWHPQAEAGYDKAQATMGWMYQTGKGVKKNYNTAYDWYMKAANQNHVVAQNNLGVFYEQGLGKVHKNLKKAAAWYREAAELGYPYAQYNLGILYLHGAGVAKNINEAIYWLQIASLQGVLLAQNELNKISQSAGGKGAAHTTTTSTAAPHKPSWIRHDSSSHNPLTRAKP